VVAMLTVMNYTTPHFRIQYMLSLDCDTLIVGSGVVGNTLACALLQGGQRVILVEATPALPIDLDQPDLRTFAFTRASERILTRLGVWDKIRPNRLSPFHQIYVWDTSGSGKIHFDSASLQESTLGYIIEQKVLQAALTARLSEFADLISYRPAKVQSFQQTEDETAMVVGLDNGQCLTTRLLVSAEGAQSSIRALAGISYELHDYGQQAIVATVQTVLSHEQTAWQCFLPTGPLAFLPLVDSHTCSIVWSLDTPQAQRLIKLDSDKFQRELETAFAFKLGAINHGSERALFPLQGRHVTNYVQPRLALVGDAAHTVHPLAGQGANLGILDAASLSEVILEAQANQRDWGTYQELRRYERWRKGNNWGMLKLMEGFRLLFGSTVAPIRLIRNWGLNLTDAATPIKQFIMKQAMGLTGDLPKLAKSKLG